MRWNGRVIVDGTDLTARVTGLLTIQQEESAATSADVRLVPTVTPIALSEWVGLPVTIDYLDLDAAGNEVDSYRLFTGVVDEPEYDPVTREVLLTCSDDRQQRLEAQSREALDVLIGGYYSDDVTGEITTNLEYAETLLQTVPAALDIRPDTNAFTLTDWAAKATPDHTITRVIDSTMQVTVASRRELVNSVRIELDYRFTRFRERAHEWIWVWNGSGDFCNWFDDTTELPNLPMVEQASAGTNWVRTDPVTYTALPPSAADPCNTGANWVNPQAWDPLLLEAEWVAYQWGTQVATERYALTVESPTSIAQVGEVLDRDRAGITTEADTDDWPDRIPELGAPVVDALGDNVWDQADRDALGDAGEVLLRRARNRVLDSHRRNLVRFSVPLLPTVDLPDTVAVDAEGVVARGKVWRLVHTMDFSEDGQVPQTQITLAVSRAGGDGVTEPAWELPTPPDTQAPGDPPDALTLLPTQLGGKASSPPYDEDQAGFAGNYSVIELGTETYPRRFTVASPEVDAGARDPVEAEATAIYSVAVPHEPLELTL
ncbi:hypothetical protein J2T57_002590 [Natronocella acetinitrilica]|uniref:Uncharacterized protein n=1 Tax=Natronocella acetinitrilica TaxID=414046 RepID=A0AAE3KBE8_9GAMM|nr:hypothetical protein [Natronocella acetinitrilica]MCP1675440.1 hypothetical protein [Natronocella acetinitrilica]